MKIEIEKDEIFTIEGDTRYKDGVLLSFYLESGGKIDIEMDENIIHQLEQAIKKAKQIIE